MSAPKVSLKPIQALHLENIMDADKVLGAETIAEVFRGSDLKFDGKTRSLSGPSKASKEPLTIGKEAAYLRMLRKADKNADGYLDVDETRNMLRASFPGVSERIDPAQYLQQVQELIRKRYQPIAVNFDRLYGTLLYKPLLDDLQTYSDGILKDDLRHASSVLPLNGLTKSVGNLVTWPFYNAYRGAQKVLRFLPKPDKNWYPCDLLAIKGAQERHQERNAALKELRKALKDGFEKGEKWALTKDFASALNQLSPTSKRILEKHIPALQIFKILEMDPKKRSEEMLKFAKEERPGFLGLGGGNSSSLGTANVFNYLGWHRNVHFMRSAFANLGSKTNTADAIFDKNIRKQSVELRKDVLGGGGSFTNLVAVGVSAPICWTGYALSAGNRIFKTCERTKFRGWGDEARMDLVGRAMNFGLTMFGTFKGFQYMKEAWSLRRMEGFSAVKQVTKESFGIRPKFLGGKNGFQPIPAQAMTDARIKAAATLKNEGGNVEPGWLGKKLNAVKDSLFGKLPPLDDKTLKTLSAVSQGGGKFITKLTDYVIVPLAVATPADRAAQAHFNPFDTNFEMEIAPYPDIRKPDPAFNADPDKKSEKQPAIRKRSPRLPVRTPIRKSK